MRYQNLSFYRFFIILKGGVSIYLDAKHDEKGLPTEKNPFFPAPPPRRPSMAPDTGNQDSQGNQSAGSRDYQSAGRRAVIYIRISSVKGSLR